MPVIQMPNPLTAASEAVGGYTAQKNENTDRADARRERDTRLALERERLASTEKYQESTLDLTRKRDDETHRLAIEAKAERDAKNTVDAEQRNYEISQRPFAESLARLKADEARGSITANEAATRFNNIQTDAKKLENEHIAKLHKLGLDTQAIEDAHKESVARVAQYAATTFRALHPVTSQGSGVQQEKLKDTRAEAGAEYDVVKQIIDDFHAQGKTPLELRQIVTGSKDVSNVTKLKLLRYVQGLKPVAESSQPGLDVGGMLKGAAKAISPFWPGAK